MLSQATNDALERYWAERFGCIPELIRQAGVLVAPHAADLRSYAGLYAYYRDNTCVLSVPEPYVTPANEAVSGQSARQVFDPAALRAILGDAAGIVVGPASLAYADASTFRPSPTRETRRLGSNDGKLLRGLAAGCDATEWDHADIEYEREPIFGCLVGGPLVAAASYRIHSGAIASIGIITHPAYRGRGYASAAASAATAHALDAGFIAQWQTLEANAPSIAVARALGFKPYCRTIAVRMKQL